MLKRIVKMIFALLLCLFSSCSFAILESLDQDLDENFIYQDQKIILSNGESFVIETYKNSDGRYAIYLFREKERGLTNSNMGGIRFESNPPNGTIQLIKVDNELQNRGFGKILLNLAFDLFKKQAVSTVRLQSSQSNSKAYNWYKRLGFVWESNDCFFPEIENLILVVN